MSSVCTLGITLYRQIYLLFFYYFIDKIHSTHLIREDFTSTFVYAKKKEDERMKKRIKGQLIKPPEWMISITACFRLSDGRSRQFFEIMIPTRPYTQRIFFSPDWGQSLNLLLFDCTMIKMMHWHEANGGEGRVFTVKYILPLKHL